MNQPDRNQLGGSQVIIQQYARYPGAMEPTIHSASSVGSARSSVAASKSPPLNRKKTPASVQASPANIQPARPVASMSPPVFNSPRQKHTTESYPTESRNLPPRELNDDTIDDAYVAFIFFCNPNVPPSTSTYELRRNFRSPPRSDGKNFNVFSLWELIKKLDSKELKTWIQLSIELGVEPPSMEKKQSTQKVQQYAVRLKVRSSSYSSYHC